MKVILIQPPYSVWPGEPKTIQPPLGLLYLAAVLEKEQHIIQIIDSPLEGYEQEIGLEDGRYRYGLTVEEIIERIALFSPEIIGISCSFSTMHDTIEEISDAIKQFNSKIKICVGGAHPTAVPEEVLSMDSVDFIVMGEGEYRFRELLSTISANGNLKDIDGLGYKINNQTVLNPSVDFIANLDELPFPARHLIDMEKYFRINRPQGGTVTSSRATTIITSRGCPAKCIFCSIHGIWGKKFRAHSAEYVIGEIEHLVQKYKVEELVFEDDNLTFDTKRADKIFSMMIEKKFNLFWKTPNGVAVWRLTEELLSKMKESGCYHVCFAIESGNDHVLHKIIHKPTNLAKVKNLVKAAKKSGILVEAFFVMGFPGETFEMMNDSFKFALKADFDKAGFCIATPYPGTQLFDQCKKEGYLRKDYSYKNLITRRGNINTPEFTSEQLEKFVAKSILKFQILKLVNNPKVTIKIIFMKIKSDPRTMAKWLYNRLVEVFRWN